MINCSPVTTGETGGAVQKRQHLTKRRKNCAILWELGRYVIELQIYSGGCHFCRAAEWYRICGDLTVVSWGGAYTKSQVEGIISLGWQKLESRSFLKITLVAWLKSKHKLSQVTSPGMLWILSFLMLSGVVTRVF